ncbi:hypothetical protein SAMN04489752_0917 [Brevibacterium siliguriense]|uniref:Uncharacterized protein n=1 Tax=Brevibacterium siliguriense TaxID=1136497 RepID=A0A1H1P7F9_9MICO|nr:hypothetical protein [Brevibacterium siliguriense]SDS07206.1 hypothetical protein SAMN04489752_0917 [Brevibacterium siliguriense]
MKRFLSGLRKKATKTAVKDDDRFGTGLWRHNRDRFIRAVDRYYTTAVALHEARGSGDSAASGAASATVDETSDGEVMAASATDPVDVIVDGTHRLNALVDVVDDLTATLHTRFPVTGQVVPGPARQAVGDTPELLTKASSKVGEAVLAASMARSDGPLGRSIVACAEAADRFVTDAEELLGRAKEILARVEAS